MKASATTPIEQSRLIRKMQIESFPGSEGYRGGSGHWQSRGHRRVQLRFHKCSCAGSSSVIIITIITTTTPSVKTQCGNLT